MIDFSNTEIAFSSKSDFALKRAYLLFSTIRHPHLVRFLKGMSSLAINTHIPVGWAIKPTLYEQFVGGETLDDSTKCLAELAAYNVRSILDYSAEGGESMADIENTLCETLRSIEYAKGNPNVAYTVFKPSALTTDAVLEKASERRDELTFGERVEFELFCDRMWQIGRAAAEAGVRLLVDAEDYCFQAAIDEVTEDMMRRFNKTRAIVFTTLQMYRHDRMQHLEELYADAEKNDYILGIKFVRGAYMEHERHRAAERGYPSPICADKAATDLNFNNGLRFTVEHIDRIETFCGTHNEESNHLLAELIDAHGIAKNDPRIWFVQLFGMSDNITYNIAHAGYNAAKYIPYGPVDKALPYLMRRAEENTSVAGQTSRELDMLKTEIERRKKC